MCTVNMNVVNIYCSLQIFMLALVTLYSAVFLEEKVLACAYIVVVKCLYDE